MSDTITTTTLVNHTDATFRLQDDVLTVLDRDPDRRVMYRGKLARVAYVREWGNGTVELAVRVGGKRPTIWLKHGDTVEAEVVR